MVAFAQCRHVHRQSPSNHEDIRGISVKDVDDLAAQTFRLVWQVQEQHNPVSQTQMPSMRCLTLSMAGKTSHPLSELKEVHKQARSGAGGSRYDATCRGCFFASLVARAWRPCPGNPALAGSWVPPYMVRITVAIAPCPGTAEVLPLKPRKLASQDKSRPTGPTALVLACETHTLVDIVTATSAPLLYRTKDTLVASKV